MHLDKNQSRIFAKAIMQELYNIQQTWNAWEKAIADLCSNTREAGDGDVGNIR